MNSTASFLFVYCSTMTARISTSVSGFILKKRQLTGRKVLKKRSRLLVFERRNEVAVELDQGISFLQRGLVYERGEF